MQVAVVMPCVHHQGTPQKWEEDRDNLRCCDTRYYLAEKLVVVVHCGLSRKRMERAHVVCPLQKLPGGYLLPPMRVTVVPQSGQVPLVALRPFFKVTSWGFFISTILR